MPSLRHLFGKLSERGDAGMKSSGRPVALLVKGKGLSLPKKAIFKYFLDSEHLMDLALKAGASLQHLFLKKIPEESGLRLRFPVPLLDSRRFIPPLARGSLFGRPLRLDPGRKRNHARGPLRGLREQLPFPPRLPQLL